MREMQDDCASSNLFLYPGFEIAAVSDGNGLFIDVDHRQIAYVKQRIAILVFLEGVANCMV